MTPLTPLLLGAWLAAAPPSSAPMPTVEQVQAAAVARASLPASAARGWLGRARSAAWLPRLGLQLDLDADRGYQLDQEAGSPDELTSDAGRSRGWRLAFTWELDRVVFNPDELRAARSALDVLDHRNALIEHVTGLYFQRATALAELSGAADPAAGAGIRLRIAELDARLQALTGLSFPAPAPPPSPG